MNYTEELGNSSADVANPWNCLSDTDETVGTMILLQTVLSNLLKVDKLIQLISFVE